MSELFDDIQGEPSQQMTILEYDFAGKITEITYPKGNHLRFFYAENYGWLDTISNDAGEKVAYSHDINSHPSTVSILDASGILKKKEKYRYDFRGQLERTYLPNETDYNEFAYGDLGQMSSITDANGNVTDFNYDDLYRLESIERTTGGNSILTQYEYDKHNNLTKVIDPDGHEYTFEYDDRGDLIKENSEVYGSITYTYDPSGNLLSRTDADDTTISYTYDALNRLTSVNYPDTELNTIYYYDQDTLYGSGRLYREEKNDVSIDYRYDAFGRIVKEIEKIYDTTDTTHSTYTAYTTSYAYDKNDNVTSIIYPSGERYLYGYNSADRVTAISWEYDDGYFYTLASDIAYEPFGGIKSITYGNDITTEYTYNERYMLDDISTGLDNIVSQSYTYDSLGNLMSIHDALDTVYNTDFAYDSVGRLTQASSSSFANGDLQFVYSDNGNRVTKIEGTDTTIYHYSSNKLDTLSGHEDVAIVTDADGKITRWTENGSAINYHYDDANRLLYVDSGSVTIGTYQYNTRNQRYHRVWGFDNRTYVYSAQGLMMSEYRSSGGWDSDYIYLYGLPIAKIMKHYDGGINSFDSLGGGFETMGIIGPPPDTIIDPPIDPPALSNDIFFYHKDYLGTPLAMTDTNKTIRWSAKHYPFGKLYDENISTTNYIRFPGQWADNETGMYYNWNRYYQPRTGRYLSADPIGLSGGSNLYTYASNNPTGLADPSGLWVPKWDPENKTITAWAEAGDGLAGLYNQLGISASEFAKNQGIEDLSTYEIVPGKTSFDISNNVLVNRDFSVNAEGKNWNCFTFVGYAIGAWDCEGSSDSEGKSFIAKAHLLTLSGNLPHAGDIAIWKYTGDLVIVPPDPVLERSGVNKMSGDPAHAAIYLIHDLSGTSYFLNRSTKGAPVTLSTGLQVQQAYKQVLLTYPQEFHFPGITTEPEFYRR